MRDDDDDDDDGDGDDGARESEGERKAGKVRIILSTCPQDKAEELATFLVEGGHAACVNIVPLVTSVYRWEGKLHKEPESLLVAKSPKKAARAAAEALRDKHPYKVPEILILTVKGGNPAYLDWVCAIGRGSEVRRSG